MLFDSHGLSAGYVRHVQLAAAHFRNLFFEGGSLMGGIKGYLVAIVAACMLTVVASVLVQKSPLKKIVRLIGGILILLVAVTPLLRLDLTQIVDILQNGEYSFDTSDMEQKRQALLEDHIKQTTEAYIENEAARLGATVQAKVTLTEEEYPVPYHAILIGSVDTGQMNALTAYMETCLGIARTEQEWRLYGTGE